MDFPFGVLCPVNGLAYCAVIFVWCIMLCFHFGCVVPCECVEYKVDKYNRATVLSRDGTVFGQPPCVGTVDEQCCT